MTVTFSRKTILRRTKKRTSTPLNQWEPLIKTKRNAQPTDHVHVPLLNPRRISTSAQLLIGGETVGVNSMNSGVTMLSYYDKRSRSMSNPFHIVFRILSRGPVQLRCRLGLAVEKHEVHVSKAGLWRI
jgi:hypothetical protein